jgi:hypothetical protein
LLYDSDKVAFRAVMDGLPESAEIRELAVLG